MIKTETEREKLIKATERVNAEVNELTSIAKKAIHDAERKQRRLDTLYKESTLADRMKEQSELLSPLVVDFETHANKTKVEPIEGVHLSLSYSQNALLSGPGTFVHMRETIAIQNQQIELLREKLKKSESQVRDQAETIGFIDTHRNTIRQELKQSEERVAALEKRDENHKESYGRLLALYNALQAEVKTLRTPVVHYEAAQPNTLFSGMVDAQRQTIEEQAKRIEELQNRGDRKEAAIQQLKENIRRNRASYNELYIKYTDLKTAVESSTVTTAVSDRLVADIIKLVSSYSTSKNITPDNLYAITAALLATGRDRANEVKELLANEVNR